MADRKNKYIKDAFAVSGGDSVDGERPTLTVDFEKYLSLTEGFDLNEDQQRELITALWDIMISFADMGFGIDATSSACGEMTEIIGLDTQQRRDVVKSDIQTLTETFNQKRGTA